MFSSIFGKRRSSPVEGVGSDPLLTPPIPGPRNDDGFVVVDPSQAAGLYPSVTGMGGPAYQRPAPSIPKVNQDQTFHYLQGVPFSLSRELNMAANVDAFAIQIGDILAYAANKINLSNCNYDFSVERSVIKECQNSLQ